MEGLELASTEELIEELMGRYDHAVFAGYTSLTKGTKELPPQEVMSLRNTGHFVMCLGLAQMLQQSIPGAMDDPEEECEEWNDGDTG